MTAGATRWIVPDGWMPRAGTAEIDGHEAVCLLNLGEADAAVTLTLYFEDRDPIVVDGLECAARRTRHIRLDRSEEMNGTPVPAETPYALVVDATQPVYVQHTRVDTRSSALALMTTMAIAADGDGGRS